MEQDDLKALEAILELAVNGVDGILAHATTSEVIEALHLIERRKTNEHLKNIANELRRIQERTPRGKPPYSGPG